MPDMITVEARAWRCLRERLEALAAELAGAKDEARVQRARAERVEARLTAEIDLARKRAELAEASARRAWSIATNGSARRTAPVDGEDGGRQGAEC
jgi:hypothetical protein